VVRPRGMEIVRRAYELWEQAGNPHNLDIAGSSGRGCPGSGGGRIRLGAGSGNSGSPNCGGVESRFDSDRTQRSRR